MALGIGTIIGLIGSGISAMAQMQAGKAAEGAARQTAEMNRRQAAREFQIGKINEARILKQTAALNATQIALLGGSGGDPSTGSALLIQGNVAEQGAYEAALAKDKGEMLQQSKLAESITASMYGSNALTASYYRAGTTLLKGGATAFG